jgi:hypothetical protein
VYPAKARNPVHVSVPRHGRSLRSVEDREQGNGIAKLLDPLQWRGGSPEVNPALAEQIGQQCKNESAPDSLSHEAHRSNSPPPKTAQQQSKAALTGREWPVGAKHRLHDFTGTRSIKRWPTSVRSAGRSGRKPENDPSS